MKKIFIILFGLFPVGAVFGNNGPALKNPGLPGGTGVGTRLLTNLVDEFIVLVAVLAVFALILSGIFYLVSAGNDEKTARAKKWIIWSLVGVFLASISWGIVNLLNTIHIN